MCTQPAVSDSRAPAERGQQSDNYIWYKWKISMGILWWLGPAAEDQWIRRRSVNLVGLWKNGDPLPHSAGTGGLHVGYQPNRGRGRAAKPIIWAGDQYMCVRMFLVGWMRGTLGKPKIFILKMLSSCKKSSNFALFVETICKLWCPCPRCSLSLKRRARTAPFVWFCIEKRAMDG